jgi:tellurite resistance protein TerC
VEGEAVELSRTFEVTTLVVLTALLLFDLALVLRRPHVPSFREAGLWVTFYVALALGFFVLLLMTAGPVTAGEFLAGWATEYSLSVDNLFVFVIIMSRFAVPRDNQQTVLLIGIILSLVLRGACILLGAAAIEAFSWVFYLFGAFLVYTAIQLLRSHGHDEEYKENALIRRARRVLPISQEYDGARLSTRVNGRRMLTPMVIVLLAIGSTDVLFALDSIPAIFGLTQDPFVVFTATLFALMGLRQLYFLLGGLLDRLVYLSYGLSVILAFIGVKLILEALHSNELSWINGGEPVAWAPVVPIWLSLSVIFGVLAVTTVLSLVVAPRRARRRAQQGVEAASDHESAGAPH